jgi:HEAT repeat protein
MNLVVGVRLCERRLVAQKEEMMKTCPACAVLVFCVIGIGHTWGGPPLREEGERRAKLVEDLKKSLAAEATAAGKFAVLERALKAEPSPNVRRVVVESVPPLPGPELDAFLTNVLTGDADAGIRSLSATVLGRSGSEKCVTALAHAAATDRTTDIQRGCMVGQSSARRAATFAIAELAARFPKGADDAAAKLRALTPPADPKDRESLADARVQALYQITRDKALLKPFFERLQSRDAKTRENGVVAFQFLKLKAAPPELVAAMKDDDRGVRSWAALVLGEVGDPKTIPVLIAVAVEPKEDPGARCNAIFTLGRMKAAVAADSLRKLLADENMSVQTNAAIALYRITGEKVKQFPEGYNAD